MPGALALRTDVEGRPGMMASLMLLAVSGDALVVTVTGPPCRLEWSGRSQPLDQIGISLKATRGTQRSAIIQPQADRPEECTAETRTALVRAGYRRIRVDAVPGNLPMFMRQGLVSGLLRVTNPVTTDDYPPTALRKGEEGPVAADLVIGPNGRVETCSIIASSGSRELDDTTCRLLIRRARFRPLPSGRQQSYRYTTSWKIPIE